MGKKREPGRKRNVRELPTPILQVMPKRRVRLDPTITPHIAVWLVSAKSGWERALQAPYTAVTDAQKVARANHDQRCRVAISVVMELVERLRETQSLDDIDVAAVAVRMGMASVGLPDVTFPHDIGRI